MKVSEFDYELPKELIAQTPIEGRSGSRMLVLEGTGDCGEVEHKYFTDFADYLMAGDVLVLNDTKVIPARLLGRRDNEASRRSGLEGAAIEIFLLKPLSGGLWQALIKNSRRLKIGEIVTVSPVLSVKILEKGEVSLVELIFEGDLYEILEEVGEIPLPPYISRAEKCDSAHADKAVCRDKEVYQTVFANVKGSVAAPTAGLHFTPEILDKIAARGVKICYVTLTVGLGTFLPVKAETVKEHKMHSESFSIPPETAALINSAKASGKNIVAVGTTVTRTLEATYQKHGKIIATADDTDIFIYPPYGFRVVDKLLTNFHLPKSTLIMLVCAFMGKENTFAAYKEAVKQKYRFFSYGDCMFLNKLTKHQI